MRMLGILDRQIMQMELRLDAQQKIAVRLQKSDPDDMVRLLGPVAGLLDRNVRDAAAGRIDA